MQSLVQTHLNGLPPKDKEVFCSLHHEIHKLLTQNPLNLVCLQESMRDYSNWASNCTPAQVAHIAGCYGNTFKLH